MELSQFVSCKMLATNMHSNWKWISFQAKMLFYYAENFAENILLKEK